MKFICDLDILSFRLVVGWHGMASYCRLMFETVPRCRQMAQRDSCIAVQISLVHVNGL